LNWYRKRQKLYSNYHLYKIPYIYIDSPEKLKYARGGFITLDEFWTFVDSRASSSAKNKLVSDIILKSRKRDLTVTFTSQMLDMLDKRIRKIMDFTAYCILNQEETIGKVLIFRGGYPKEHMLLKQFMYRTPMVWKLYDTMEELSMNEGDETEPKIIFQESPEDPPKFFDTWEQADKFGEKFWEKEGKELLPMMFEFDVKER